MKEYIYKNKIVIVISFITTGVLIISSAIVWQKSGSLKRTATFWEKPRVINDVVVTPNTTKVATNDGRVFVSTGQKVALVPKTKGEEVVVSSAVFTVKTGFELANNEAQKWSSDAKLVYAKSLGTVDLSGKSSAWQYAFGSKQKKKGYEVIIEGAMMTSQKETDASSFGYDLPKNWYDSYDAIVSIRSSSPFSNETLSSLLFFYSEPGRIWQYALSTSFGNTLLQVK